MADEKIGIGSENWWKSKGNIVAGFIAVAAIGIAIGRWSRRPSGPVSPSPSASSSADAGPQTQHFDLKELPGYTTGSPVRPMDKDIFAALADPNLKRTALPDLFPDRPYKVKVVGSVDDHRFALVQIDNERDGKWDERWTLKGDEVFRLLPEDPAAGGQPVQFTLSHGRWQAH